MTSALAALAFTLPLAATAGHAAGNEGEPAPGYPEDPPKVLRSDGDRGSGYKCYFENETRRKTCVDGGAVLANSDIRAAALLVGRPDRLRATGVHLVVDCRSGRTGLQQSGAPFTGDLPVSAQARAALAGELCAVTTTLADPRLRML